MASESIKLKEKQVSKITEQVKNAKTFMIVSIKGLPSKQFQAIKKSVREDAEVKVAKKNIMLRALKEFGKESILSLKEYITADCAFIISDKEGYDLASILSKKKTPVFAKAGQTASEDIEVKAGPTDLVPGPAISELGALGIQVAVEDGKISIKADKVVVNKNQEISEGAAALFQKLNIQPFSVGLNPVVIYDVESEMIYTDIKIDSEETVGELVGSASRALGFAQKIVYYCKETISYFLGKGNAEGSTLERLSGEEKSEESPADATREEEKKEDVKEESEDKVEEKKDE